MSYNEDFYKLYDEYLEEQEVRRQHDFVLGLVAYGNEHALTDRVVDLGCGLCEFETAVCPYAYLGIDDRSHKAGLRLDYLSERQLVLDKVRGFDATAFVSLFSTEIVMQAPSLLYEKLFDVPSIHVGLVSGFYYANRKYENPVTEAGGLVSWQTLSPPEETAQGRNFRERARIVLPVPSKLFGPDVYEVWRFLEKK